MELPRLNYARCHPRAYRFTYGIGHCPEREGDIFNRLVKVDGGARENKVWCDENCYPGEPVFVATPGASAEDAGVILSIVLNAKRRTSFLLVLDAGSFEEIARAEVPHHIPFGFHGQFFAD